MCRLAGPAFTETFTKAVRMRRGIAMARMFPHILHEAETNVQTCPKQSKNAPEYARSQPFQSILTSPIAKYHSSEMTGCDL